MFFCQDDPLFRNAFDPMYTSVRLLFNTRYDAMAWATHRRIIEATIWYACTLLLAIFIPNIGVAMNFAGSVAVFFYFVFPGQLIMRKINGPLLHSAGEEELQFRRQFLTAREQFEAIIEKRSGLFTTRREILV